MWRKVELRIGGDEKYRLLKLDAQMLWRVLLSDLREHHMPGLYNHGSHSICQHMITGGKRWKVERVDNALAEIEKAKMIETDKNAGVIYLPNALKYNPPDSSKVLLGWKHSFEIIHESPLKEKYFNQLAFYVEKWGTSFTTAFNTAFMSEYKQKIDSKTKVRIGKFTEQLVERYSSRIKGTKYDLARVIRWAAIKYEEAPQAEKKILAALDKAVKGKTKTADEAIHAAGKAMK